MVRLKDALIDYYALVHKVDPLIFFNKNLSLHIIDRSASGCRRDSFFSVQVGVGCMQLDWSRNDNTLQLLDNVVCIARTQWYTFSSSMWRSHWRTFEYAAPWISHRVCSPNIDHFVRPLALLLCPFQYFAKKNLFYGWSRFGSKCTSVFLACVTRMDSDTYQNASTFRQNTLTFS